MFGVLGSAEQKSWWLGPANALNFIGCYAQTELGYVRTPPFSPQHVGVADDWIRNQARKKGFSGHRGIPFLLLPPRSQQVLSLVF
jgi:hypothetical protein